MQSEFAQFDTGYLEIEISVTDNVNMRLISTKLSSALRTETGFTPSFPISPDARCVIDDRRLNQFTDTRLKYVIDTKVDNSIISWNNGKCDANLKFGKVFDACTEEGSNIFCTGEGGTGKSWLLSKIVNVFRTNDLYKEKTVAE
ncbi:hypothetical protein HRG_012264 [Hirsutella rhossiliensis]